LKHRVNPTVRVELQPKLHRRLTVPRHHARDALESLYAGTDA
jgi:hypothetical protein